MCVCVCVPVSECVCLEMKEAGEVEVERATRLHRPLHLSIHHCYPLPFPHLLARLVRIPFPRASPLCFLPHCLLCLFPPGFCLLMLTWRQLGNPVFGGGVLGTTTRVRLQTLSANVNTGQASYGVPATLHCPRDVTSPTTTGDRCASFLR